MAVRVWNALGGVIDWAGLDVLVVLYGIDDVESLVQHLLLIRDYKRDNPGGD